MSNLCWLTDEQMARLQPYFPKSHGRPWVDDRRVLGGIVFVNRNGFAGPMHQGSTVHTRRSTTAVSGGVRGAFSSA